MRGLGFGYLGWASLLAQGVQALPAEQIPLSDQETHHGFEEHAVADKRRPLHGRFLHVTDFHPDAFYQIYSSTAEDSACHRGEGPAGYYGAETSECDSPIALVNATMKWIEQEFKDNVDFVIWTGDSARHDNDEELPRSPTQVRELNEFMVQKMFEVFGKRNGDEEDDDPNNDYEVPVIPTFGNNDILPHNIMSKGPNLWTRTYLRVWRQFIPEPQRHSFEQGGWFYVEAIPNKLAVFSLNTMYFFTSNAAVDGCAAHSEPGYRQLEWLRIQLQFMRQRGMKAILIGHVPPARQDAKTSWDETCWQKYALWMQQYRDVVVTTLYGHMNYDHFILQDFKKIDEDTRNGLMRDSTTEAVNFLEADGDFHAELSSSYFTGMRDEWAKLPKTPKSMKWPHQLEVLGEAGDEEWDVEDIISALSSGKKDKKDKKGKKGKDDKEKEKEKEKRKQKKFLKKMGGQYAERFSASFAGASVVPNLYPVIRIYEYNITGLENHKQPGTISPPVSKELNAIFNAREEEEGEDEDSSIHSSRRKYKKNKPIKFTVPDPPSKSSPPGPAYSAQTLSLLKYTQYFANITHINNDFPTNATTAAHSDDNVEAEKWHEGKHKGKKPHDKNHRPNPKEFQYQLHYDTQDDEVYRLRDLTMPSLVDLARRIGEFVPEKGGELVLSEDEGDDDQVESESSTQGKDKKDKKHKKGKGKKGDGHKGKKTHHHRKENEAWYTFIRRAYVETMNAEEIERDFGH